MKSVTTVLFLCIINLACEKRYNNSEPLPIEASVWVSFYTSDSTLTKVYDHFQIDPAPNNVNSWPYTTNHTLFYKRTEPICDSVHVSGRYPFWPNDSLTIKLFSIGNYVFPTKLIGVRLTKSLCNNVDIK